MQLLDTKSFTKWKTVVAYFLIPKFLKYDQVQITRNANMSTINCGNEYQAAAFKRFRTHLASY